MIFLLHSGNEYSICDSNSHHVTYKRSAAPVCGNFSSTIAQVNRSDFVHSRLRTAPIIVQLNVHACPLASQLMITPHAVSARRSPLLYRLYHAFTTVLVSSAVLVR